MIVTIYAFGAKSTIYDVRKLEHTLDTIRLYGDDNQLEHWTFPIDRMTVQGCSRLADITFINGRSREDDLTTWFAFDREKVTYNGRSYRRHSVEMFQLVD